MLGSFFQLSDVKQQTLLISAQQVRAPLWDQSSDLQPSQRETDLNDFCTHMLQPQAAHNSGMKRGLVEGTVWGIESKRFFFLFCLLILYYLIKCSWNFSCLLYGTISFVEQNWGALSPQRKFRLMRFEVIKMCIQVILVRWKYFYFFLFYWQKKKENWVK